MRHCTPFCRNQPGCQQDWHLPAGTQQHVLPLAQGSCYEKKQGRRRRWHKVGWYTEWERDSIRERQTLTLYEQGEKRRCLKEREMEEIARLFIMGCSSAWGEVSCSTKHPGPSSYIFTSKITSNRHYLAGIPSNAPSLNTPHKDFVRVIKQTNYKPVISVRCR